MMFGQGNSGMRRGLRRRLIRLGSVAGLAAIAVLMGVTAVWAARSLSSSAERPARKPIVAASPKSLTVVAGGTATYLLTAKSAKRVSLVVTKGLPPGATVSFRTKRVRRHARHPRAKAAKVTMTVKTSSQTPPASYLIKVRGKGKKAFGPATVQLVVSAAPGTHTFSITGSITAPLTPGGQQPLDLSLANSDSSSLRITALTVQIVAVQAGAPGSCSAADFSVTQFSGPFGFVLPPSGTRTLAELGIPSSAWPSVAMLNRPVNQDGCKNASLKLGFGGTAIGGEA